MRRQYLALMALLAVGVSAPAWAQIVTTVTAAAPATPEIVVARLMSFDRNTDGRVVVDELPERMQSLVSRGDSSSDGALDRAEIQRLAVTPASQVFVPGGLQAGRYGFGDTLSFETSKHIDGALDDLRLAGDTNERAREMARTFLAGADARAMDDLMATMGDVLSKDQLDDFRASMSARTIGVPAVRRDGVTFFGARPEEAAGQERVIVRLAGKVDLERHIETYGLDAERKAQAVAAIRQFKVHTPGRLNEAERLALVEQFRGLLTDEQRDDLRAALERRPIVKLAGVAAFTSGGQVRIERQAVPQATEPTGGFVLQDLVLRR